MCSFFVYPILQLNIAIALATAQKYEWNGYNRTHSYRFVRRETQRTREMTLLRQKQFPKQERQIKEKKKRKYERNIIFGAGGIEPLL